VIVTITLSLERFYNFSTKYQKKLTCLGIGLLYCRWAYKLPVAIISSLLLRPQLPVLGFSFSQWTVNNELTPSKVSIFFPFYSYWTWFNHRSSRNKYKKSERASLLWPKVLPTEKCLVTSFSSKFQIYRQPRRIRNNRDHQKFLLMQGYLSKVKFQFF